jgi:hypothetical protein
MTTGNHSKTSPPKGEWGDPKQIFSDEFGQPRQVPEEDSQIVEDTS